MVTHSKIVETSCKTIIDMKIAHQKVSQKSVNLTTVIPPQLHNYLPSISYFVISVNKWFR